jgi:diguanylate cyclase (GGDEF)-like protein
VSRRCIQISMGPNKIGSFPCKRRANTKFGKTLFDYGVLGMAVDSQPLCRRDVSRSMLRREKEAMDEVFQALIAEANQEFANLLRDVRKGSQGGLFASSQIRLMNELLIRAVRCATKQYLLQAELGNLVLTDELTGLYNRRGFMALAERQLKLGRRSGREMLLFFIDVDSLKCINDSFGHSEGDRALKRTAKALEKTFRESDVIARLGGDEFATLAIEASGYSESTIMARLRKYLNTINAGETRYKISFSVGVARFDHGNPTSITNLMAQADQAMYEQKRSRSSPENFSEVISPC